MLFTRMAIPATHSRTEHPLASNRCEASFSIGGWHLSQSVGGTFLNRWMAPFSIGGWHLSQSVGGTEGMLAIDALHVAWPSRPRIPARNILLQAIGVRRLSQSVGGTFLRLAIDRWVAPKER
jgi:hypothetical protein